MVPLHEGWPRVTGILSSSGLVNVEWCSAEDRDRGSAVHKATEYWDQNELDLASVEASVMLRLNSYIRFREESRVEVLEIEKRVHSTALRYTGTLDRIVVLNGRKGVLDIKGTTQDHWHGVQLAGYALCIAEPLARWNLYLRDDGYQLVERRDRADFDVFRAALTLTNWRKQHGIK